LLKCERLLVGPWCKEEKLRLAVGSFIENGNRDRDCGAPSIRDVIAFPKTAKGTDLMTDSPAAVSPRQLRDLHIEVKAAKKE
jgi:hypothetical protein